MLKTAMTNFFRVFKAVGVMILLLIVAVFLLDSFKSSICFAGGGALLFFGYDTMKNKYDEGKEWQAYVGMGIGALMVISAFVSDGSNKVAEDAMSNKQVAKQETTKSAEKTKVPDFTLTKEQSEEMGKAYAAVMGKQYRGLFDNWSFSYDGKTMYIEVTSKWFNLHNEDKIAFIKNAGSMYFGMMGARGFKVNTEDFEMTIKHSGSSSTLATWDYVFGPKIKK